MVEENQRKLIQREFAIDGDLMMALSQGKPETKGIVDFLYSHKMFRPMAHWLIAHKYTGDNLIAYFSDGHKLSILSLIKEVTKYQLQMEGDVFAHDFKPGPSFSIDGTSGDSSQQ